MPDAYVTKPKVYLLGRQAVVEEELARFLADEGVVFTTDTNVAAEVLNEIAGRTCYMSFGKGRKSNQEYLENILSSKHGSVLEHAVWNLLITGVSRALTHELVRHRAGFGYSQLSQRYVDESEARYVVPPRYRRKWARQAARSNLPNACETKIFVTGNSRAWRHFLEQRGSPHADTEIRLLAVEICKVLKQESPNIFHDVELTDEPDGMQSVRVVHTKV